MIPYQKVYRDVSEAYHGLMNYIHIAGVKENSRNGKVISLPGPVTVTFLAPQRRVLLDSVRDANPFFHLFESIWMLAGHNDVSYVSQFNSNIGNYSDDGVTFHGAYGFRWREHFGFDQLIEVAKMLRTDPTTRRAVMSMWSPEDDLMKSGGKDHPCNTQIAFRISDNRLDMTVFNRSNDLVWGLCGANAVHLSFMQEWVAAAAGVALGAWHQVSNNLHIYEKHWGLRPVPYKEAPAPMPLVKDAAMFLEECEVFCTEGDDPDLVYDEPFMQFTAVPMLRAWNLWKQNDAQAALAAAGRVRAPDWRAACTQWIQRRAK